MLTKNDNSHIENLLLPKKVFNNSKNKISKILIAKKHLKNIFKGNINIAMPYLTKNFYKINLYKNYHKDLIEGVLFLHDFYDSSSVFRPFIFDTYYDWTIYTLELIRKYKLNIFIKPHPNAIKENSHIISYLKNKYHDLNWINQNISNNYLFKVISYGISIHGSILYELAFHGIVPISAGGKHHSIEYDFVVNSNNKKHYKKLLLNAKKLKLKKEKIYEMYKFFYTFAIQNNDYIKTSARNERIKKLMFKDSSSLLSYIKIFKSIKITH